MYKTLSAPLVVQLEVSSRCPNNCLHCYNYWRNEEELDFSSDLSKEEVEYIMEQLHLYNIFHIVITGGEPLLNKKAVFRTIEIANKYGITCGINSTLITLTRRDAEIIRDLSPSVVIVSLMGPNAELHDAVAQRSGAFSKTVRGIKYLRELDIPISVNMVISQKNRRFIKETALFVESLLVRHFNVTKASCPGNCSDFSELALTVEEFREYLLTLRDIDIEQDISVGVLESYPLCGIKEAELYSFSTGRKCLAGVTALTISSNGDVRPCSHVDNSYGNIFEKDIGVIWNKMQEWRDGSLIPDICSSCKALPWCGGGCRMEAKTVSGSISSMDPYSVPKDAMYALAELIKDRESKERAVIPSRFSLNPSVRMRKESFGGITFVGARSSRCVNESAFTFLSTLQEERVYSLDDLKSFFVNSDSLEKFILGLVDNNILISH